MQWQIFIVVQTEANHDSLSEAANTLTLGAKPWLAKQQTLHDINSC